MQGDFEYSCDLLEDRSCPLIHDCHGNVGTNNRQSWPELDLFVRMSADFRDTFQNVLLRSLRLFWPLQHLKLVVVLDDEKEEDHKFGGELTSIASKYGLPPFKVFYESPSTTYESGYDRQQWSMFWADNYTSATYVGFMDTDTLITTRVHAGDLFECGRPLVLGVVGNEWEKHWVASSKTTALVLGKPEVMRGMTYFPVVLKVSHLAKMRQEITGRLNANCFDDAFRIFSKGSRRHAFTYSQFNIMVNYVFYHEHCDYSFSFQELIPGDRTVSEGRSPCLDTILDEMNTFPRVFVTEHNSHAQKPVDDFLLEGFCRSNSEASLKIKYHELCKDYSDAVLHEALFHFETRSWTWHAMCRKAQLRHYHAVRQEHANWPLDLLDEIAPH